MRSELSGYEGKFGKWCATVDGFSVERGTGKRVLLVKDLVDKHGDHVADHVWLPWYRLPTYGWMEKGTPFEFTGRVEAYRKLDEQKRLYVTDFEIVSIINIKRVECY